MTIRKYPAHTNRADINLALATLGFDSDAVISLTIDGHGIDAEILAYDAQGNHVVIYDETGEQQPKTYDVFIPHNRKETP